MIQSRPVYRYGGHDNHRGDRSFPASPIRTPPPPDSDTTQYERPPTPIDQELLNALYALEPIGETRHRPSWLVTLEPESENSQDSQFYNVPFGRAPPHPIECMGGDEEDLA